MSPSIRTMGFFMSEINFCNTKEQLNHLGEVVTGKVDGSPSGADIDTSTLPYTGQVRKTLPALEVEYEQSIANKEVEADAAIDQYRLLSKGPYAVGVLLEDKFQYITYNGESYFAANPPYTTTATTPDADGNLFAGGYTTLENVANKIGNKNELSNSNFLTPSPDAITHPNATPESYVSGTQIFSGVYAGDSGCTVTFIDGRVNCTAGDYQFKLPNTGGLERVPVFTSSVSDYDGIPKTTGVSHALVGDEYLVTVTPAAGDVFSVKLEQGSEATRHEVGSLSSTNISDYTDIVYKASGGGSAVENMIAGVPVSVKTGDTCSTGGTTWKRVTVSAPSSLDDFNPLTPVRLDDAITDYASDNSSLVNQLLEKTGKFYSDNEIRVKATVLIPSNADCDGCKFYADGDDFTAAFSPAAIVQNKTFGSYANSDKNVKFRHGSVRLINNTPAFSPKLIMLGGVDGAHILDNEVEALGGKHSSLIECYKSTRNVWIQENRGKALTGNVTGGGIWLANRNQTDVSENIHVDNNTLNQNSIDEIIAVFPNQGPMRHVYGSGNDLTRENSGASNAPLLRIFTGDGLAGGQPTASLKTVRFKNTTVNQLKTDNVVSGVVQIGNASSDNIDPEDVKLTDTTIKGYFAGATIAMRFDFNSRAKGVKAVGTYVINEGAFDALNSGIVDPSGQVVVSGGRVEGFGTNIRAFVMDGIEVDGGSVGAICYKLCKNMDFANQLTVPLRLVENGYAISVTDSTLAPSANKRCLQVDCSSSNIDKIDLYRNDFIGSEGGVTAIEKLGSNTVTSFYLEQNDLSSVSTLWNNNMNIVVGRNKFAPVITNPVGNISANPSSVFYNPAGGASSTLYVKEANTGSSGWVAK